MTPASTTAVYSAMLLCSISSYPLQLINLFSIDKYLNCFQHLAIMNKAAMNIMIHLIRGTYVCISLSSIPKREASFI